MLSGYKTYAAAAVMVFICLNEQFKWFPQLDRETIITLATALGFVGVRHALGNGGKK